MYTTQVTVPQVVSINIDVPHKFKAGDVVFPIQRPEEDDETILGIYAREWDRKPTGGLMYQFVHPNGGTYGRSVEWVDKHYMKARP